MRLILILMIALSLKVSAQVELKLDSVCADSGIITTVNFTTKNFTNIATAQGSITWDPAKLSFVGVSNYNANLTGLSGSNINLNDTANGNIAFAWFDASASGLSLSDGSIIFTAQFNPITPGESAPIQFADLPTQIEISTPSSIVSDTTISGAVNIANVATSSSGTTMMANNNSASYVWLDCDDNHSPILGATSQSYTAIENGNYAVQLTENGCVDTSACIVMMSVGIIKSSFSSALMIYPNPTNGNFSVDLGDNYQSLTTTMVDVSGKVIQSKVHDERQLLHLTIEEPAGVYTLIIESEDKKAVIRIVKK